MGNTMGTGNVHDDDLETLQFADEGDDNDDPDPSYVERESWLGKTVIIAHERDGVALGRYPGLTEAHRYEVLEVSHGHGSFRLRYLATGRDRLTWEHGSQLIELDQDGREVRGYYMTGYDHTNE